MNKQLFSFVLLVTIIGQVNAALPLAYIHATAAIAPKLIGATLLFGAVMATTGAGIATALGSKKTQNIETARLAERSSFTKAKNAIVNSQAVTVGTLAIAGAYAGDRLAKKYAVNVTDSKVKTVAKRTIGAVVAGLLVGIPTYYASEIWLLSEELGRSIPREMYQSVVNAVSNHKYIAAGSAAAFVAGLAGYNYFASKAEKKSSGKEIKS